MKRISMTPRPNLSTRIGDLGFEFASLDDGRLYWDETLRYAFTLVQIEQDFEAPTNELWGMCLEVAARAAVDGAMLTRLGIPAALHDRVAQSWRERQPSLYGRFDLAYDGRGPAKMLELNADTPTSLYEAAVFQWHWLEDCRASGALPSDADQFNALHERLIERWRQIVPARSRVHAACMDNVEDRVTAEYVADTAAQAGLQASCLTVRQIGLRAGRLVDTADAPIETLFKLYPWEWLIRDTFGTSEAVWHTRMVEPAWKMMLSTKALLVELWRLFPHHPNLLEAHPVPTREAGHPLTGRDHVLKPVHAREGANVMVLQGGTVVAQTSGSYDGPFVAQARAANLFRTAGGHAIIGCWIVGDQASGVGIREDAGLITTNTARFVPHAIVDRRWIPPPSSPQPTGTRLGHRPRRPHRPVRLGLMPHVKAEMQRAVPVWRSEAWRAVSEAAKVRAMVQKMRFVSSLILAAAVPPARVEAQDANPYSGAAGYLYSQGRTASPGLSGGAFGPKDRIPAAPPADPSADPASSAERPPLRSRPLSGPRRFR